MKMMNDDRNIQKAWTIDGNISFFSFLRKPGDSAKLMLNSIDIIPNFG